VISAVDGYYNDNSCAVAVAVVFSSFSDKEPYAVYIKKITAVAEYISGEFYKRELPCILAVLGGIKEGIDTVIIDGYVDPGNKPGLGRRLWEAMAGKITVIGVAKNYFHGTDAIKIFRKGSRRPLYVTSAGIDAVVAGDMIKNMYGKYRMPDLLKIADTISRTGNKGQIRSDYSG